VEEGFMDQVMMNGEGDTPEASQQVTGKTILYTGLGIMAFFFVTLIITFVMTSALAEKPILRMSFDYVGQENNEISSYSLSLEEGDYYCVLTVSGSPNETVTLRILDGDGVLQWEGVTEESASDFDVRLDTHSVLVISYDGSSKPETVIKHISLVCYAR
jgi:hypothetical protein